jgi:MFS superfamily sulfate permease-like transporter
LDKKTTIIYILGGVTNAIISLPIALAFGVASGLGGVSGLLVDRVKISLQTD